MLWLIAPAINLKTGDKKNYSSSFYCSFYWATLIFGYLAYSSSTTYAANEDNKEENTFGGYPCLFVWNCRLYWAADCLHACTVYGLAKSRFQFAHAMLACSRLSVSEDDRKSERATSRISCEWDPGVGRRGQESLLALFLKPHSAHLKKETVSCVKMSNVKISVCSV